LPGKTAAIAPDEVPPLTGNLNQWLALQKVRITGIVNCYQVEVTPAIAASWLLFNQSNRNPSKAKIRRFAASIVAGKWIINGESIKFSSSGRLLDGQSRLMAIVLANVPAILEVRSGLPDIAQASMDNGEVRKGSHTLEMLGENNPKLLATALKFAWLMESGMFEKSSFGSKRVLENSELKPLLEKHLALKASVGWAVTDGHKLSNFIPRSEGAFWHYWLGRVDPVMRDRFFSSLLDGVGLTKVSPIYHLRERFFMRNRGVETADRAERAAIIIKAWNATLRGLNIASLAWRATGPTAEKFPVILTKENVA